MLYFSKYWSNNFLFFSKSYFYYIFSLFYGYFLLNLLGEKDSSFLVKELFFIFIFYSFFLIISSFISFCNDSFTTSFLNLLLELFFITWIITYIPDFFIYGLKSFNNKLISLDNFFFKFFIFIIEFFSFFIKSFVLSLRINTNLISGHLLFSILFLFFEFSISLFSNIFSFYILIFLFILEFFIIFIQCYVLFLLLIIYLQENLL